MANAVNAGRRPELSTTELSTHRHSSFEDEIKQYDLCTDKLEHWYGRSYESDNGQFDICVTSLHNDQEQYLFIRMDRNHRLSVGVGDASWTAKVGEIEQASLRLDHISLFTGSASAVSKDLFAMDLPNANQTLADMSVTKIMLLKIGAHSAMFRLEGIEGALDALFDCVDHGVNAHGTT